MCRIVGGWEFAGASALYGSLANMRDAMSAGGPDDFGAYFSCSTALALGHRRLSVIDLSSFSHQPFISQDGRFVLVFNGEIYNYTAIAKKLLQEGISLKAQSDTEVLLASLMHWGVECIKDFDGMFAFALWDELKQTLLLCRDRVGVKPLYYYFDGKRFLFASELKALFAYPHLRKNINKESLGYFFAYGYIPAPLCILENTHKLQAGHYLTIDSRAHITQGQYYNPKQYSCLQNSLVLQTFREVLLDSVGKRMVSDVPVGVLLSGGIDSSLVCVALKELGYHFETFTIGFEEQSFNESHYAQVIADCLGVSNNTFVCSLQEAKCLVERLPLIYDEPFGDSSAIPTLLISQKIRKFVKVALSADGGDELGIGYDRYFWVRNRFDVYAKWRFLSGVMSILSPEISVAILQKLGLQVGIDKFLRIKNQLKARSFMEHYQVEITHFRKDEFSANKVLLPYIADLERYDVGDSFKSMSYCDFCSYLSDDILVKTDRASMSVGLEMREPLLGKVFVDFMLSLKAQENVQNGTGKMIFKRYLEQFLPQELVSRPKMGFRVPIENWMRKDLRYLLDDISGVEGFLDNDFVVNLIRDFDNQKRVDFSKIWYIYIFCAWRKQWGI